MNFKDGEKLFSPRQIDRIGGDLLQNAIDGVGCAKPGLFLSYGKRYCLRCKSLKPKGKRKACIEWRCDDCILRGKFK